MYLRKILFLLFVAASVFAGKIDYSHPVNWVIRDTDSQRKFDVFYVYPTMNSSKTKPLMEWQIPSKLTRKTFGFVTAQTGVFRKDARIFAPYVRQLEYHRAIDIVGNDKDMAPFEPGMTDTVTAFRYYMKHYNNGRPYILFGHSQGAMDLYELIKRCPEISPKNGFAAAYLIGLPKKTEAQIRADLAGRDITPAKGRLDTGVVIVWHAQNSSADNKLFTVPGGYCINPLNWRTDSTPGTKEQNFASASYDKETGKLSVKEQFCGAVIDPAKGALIVDLPSKSQYDSNGFMGDGVFHMNDVWFFIGNIRRNAIERIDAFTAHANK